MINEIKSTSEFQECERFIFIAQRISTDTSINALTTEWTPD